MTKRAILAVLAAFVTWAVLDFVLHVLLLKSTYEAMSELWHPMEEMNMLLMYAVTLAYVIVFVAIYGFMVADKSVASGVKFGLLFGLASGISMGFGSYCYMPIPASLAFSWFFGMWIKATVAGTLVGLILRPANQPK
jgi:hypothetical protein